MNNELHFFFNIIINQMTRHRWCLCIPDYYPELEALQKTAEETRVYLTEIENRIRLLQDQMEQDLYAIDTSIKALVKPVEEGHEECENAQNQNWVNNIASVVVKTGASIVTQQPGLTPWSSIMRLFQRRNAADIKL
jgi:hypothetical protein